MSSRKKRKSGSGKRIAGNEAQSRGRAEPRVEKASRHWRRIAVVIALVLGAGIVTAILVRRETSPNVASTPLPAPLRVVVRDSISPGDFVGAERCAECHRQQYDAWRQSTHAGAGGPPGRVRVIAAFNGAPIRFQDATVTPTASGGRVAFIVRQNGQPARTLTVDAVVGGGHMEGGGTQGFVTRWADGTFRFLPFDYSRHGGFWFCNTTGRIDRAWVRITDSLPMAACVDWPPTRVLGEEPRFNNCQSCHGSQIAVALDTAAHEYRTTFSTLAINCESCHGPGRRHLELVHDSAALASGNIGMAALATLGKDASLGTCWSCHALKDRLRPGYLSGKALASYYSIRLPQLGDAAHFPDGRVRTFAYQEGHLYSDCYVNGGMTCTSCHDPHTQGYRDVAGRALSGRFDDGQCLGCHASKADSARVHTRHRAGSPGSACTACHMPYLQEPEVGSAVRYARSDHAIPIPRPAFDSTLGITSACQGCHTDRSASTLDTQVREWYGDIKPHPRAIAALLRGRSIEDRAEAARLLLVPGERHTASLFAGMAYFLDRFLGPDMASLDKDVVARLHQLAGHEDEDVRAIALASLHFARGNVASVRSTLADALRATGESDDRLRSRWSVTLGYLADKLRSDGQLLPAIETYRKAQEIQPSNALIALNIGLAYADAGDLAAAIEQYQRSLTLDPVQPLALVNLGIAKGRQNDLAGAMDAYQRTLALNPREPLAHFNMAGLFLRQRMMDSAAARFARAAELDPSLATARVYLARLMAARGDVRGAIAELDAALEFDPNNRDLLTMRDQLRRGSRP